MDKTKEKKIQICFRLITRASDGSMAKKINENESVFSG